MRRLSSSKMLTEKMATRQASGKVINALADTLPELFGGSADLAGSNNTDIEGAADFSAEDRLGRNLRFGVREHAMGGIANGIAYHGGLVPFVATFLPFSDYMRGSVRLESGEARTAFVLELPADTRERLGQAALEWVLRYFDQASSPLYPSIGAAQLQADGFVRDKQDWSEFTPRVALSWLASDAVTRDTINGDPVSSSISFVAFASS